MKTFVYIGIIGASALLLASCKGKSKPMETPVPSISVSTPIVRDITLTKEYPGYLSSQLKVDLVAVVNGYLRNLLPQGRKPGEEGRSYLRDRTGHLSR